MPCNHFVLDVVVVPGGSRLESKLWEIGGVKWGEKSRYVTDFVCVCVCWILCCYYFGAAVADGINLDL